MARKMVKLAELTPEQVPEQLRPQAYFDFQAHRFAHEALFRRPDVNSVCAAILAIGKYAEQWLAETVARKRAEVSGLKVLTDSAGYDKARTCGSFEVLLEPGAVFAPETVLGCTGRSARHAVYLQAGARVLGGIIYLAEGHVYVGAGTVIEPAAGVRGPSILGKDCEIRQGAYLRGNCILGDNCIVRGELKNVVMMDKANFPHPCYIGDSLCGYMTHFGNQATTANLGIYEGLRQPEQRKNLLVSVGDTTYDLGTPKMGVCMGDFCQLGCGSVPDPGTFLRPYTIAYALTRINKGFYGPREVLKNKPMEHGVIERAPLEQRD